MKRNTYFFVVCLESRLPRHVIGISTIMQISDVANFSFLNFFKDILIQCFHNISVESNRRITALFSCGKAEKHNLWKNVKWNSTANYLKENQHVFYKKNYKIFLIFVCVKSSLSLSYEEHWETKIVFILCCACNCSSHEFFYQTTNSLLKLT